MATYDTPGTFWDTPGLLYDELSIPSKKKMSTAKLTLRGLSPAQIIDRLRQIATAMTGNPNFPAPVPTLAALTTAINAAEAAQAASDAARQAALLKTTERNTAFDNMRGLAMSLMGYAQAASGGDLAKLQSGAWDVRDPAVPLTMTQVLGLAATAGDMEGVVDLQWEAMRGAASYEVQISANPNDLASWTHKATVTSSTTSLTGLQSAVRCWFRVRAIGANGPGPWSDPSTKIVP